jgi:peptide-methionine (S)-S-oxide reductase
MFGFHRAPPLPTAERALPGRDTPIPLHEAHHVLGTALRGPFEGLEQAVFGMGCYWGAEKAFWTLPGVHTTAVGYAGGSTRNPSYEEVCSGRTGHTEAVLVVYDSEKLAYDVLLKKFWEGHDPTQGMRQGNDVGTQYRSVIHTSSDAQLQAALASRLAFGQALRAAGHGDITTEIIEAPQFFYAEQYHQQYLSRNPAGYCGLGGTGVNCPAGIPAP